MKQVQFPFFFFFSQIKLLLHKPSMWIWSFFKIEEGLTVFSDVYDSRYLLNAEFLFVM